MDKSHRYLNEFEVSVVPGHEYIMDHDPTADYLFIIAPKEAYAVCLQSGMEAFDSEELKKHEAYGIMELKYPDKTIRLFCLPNNGKGNVVTWYFQLEFGQAKGSRRCLPGVLRIHPETVYRIPLGGVFPFVKVLEQISVTLDEGGIMDVNQCDD